jgi:hypothetical protein
MNTNRGTFGSIFTLVVATTLVLVLAASPTLSCPEVKIDPATGAAMDVNDTVKAMPEEEFIEVVEDALPWLTDEQRAMLRKNL